MYRAVLIALAAGALIASPARAQKPKPLPYSRGTGVATQVAPATPEAVVTGGQLHFRGGRGGPVRQQFDGWDAGLYFAGADSSLRVQITSIRGDSMNVECPGEWSSVGVVEGDDYWGVVHVAPDAHDIAHRGAQGTQHAHLEPGGKVRVATHFGRAAGDTLLSTWTPLLPKLPQNDAGGQSITAEKLREIPVDNLNTSPTWPPPGQSSSEARIGDHPVWPSERGLNDGRIQLVGPNAAIDSLPVALAPRPVRLPASYHPTAGRPPLVKVKAFVGKDGRVEHAVVVDAIPELDARALDAVRHQRFRPALAHGQPVAVWVVVTVRFEPK